MNKLIRDTAKEMCGAFYDACGRSKRFRQQAGPVNEFIRKHWHEYVKPARAIMAQMLASKDTSDDDKAKIYDALLEDQSHKTRMASADQDWDQRNLVNDHSRVLIERPN